MLKEMIKFNKMIISNQHNDFTIYLDSLSNEFALEHIRALKQYKSIEFAIIHGHLEIIKKILEYSTNIKDQFFELACIHGQKDIVELFLKYCDIEETIIQENISEAIKYGHKDIFYLIFANEKFRKKLNLFKFITNALKYEENEIFNFILSDKLINQEIKSQNPKLLDTLHNCLEVSVLLNNLDAVKILFNYNIDFTSFQNYPLIEAVSCRHYDIAIFILEHYEPNSFSFDLIDKILKHINKNKNREEKNTILRAIWDKEDDKEFFKKYYIDIYTQYYLTDKINNFI
jgi:ankyrin repeat protein